MKKNKFMRFASLLLIATLLTTSVISGTFAKYVTSDSAKDTARVAKFGVVASIEGNLFGDSYSKGTSTTEGKIQSWSVNKESVSAYANSGKPSGNIVAPGTHGDTLSFTITGRPEVSTAVTFDQKTLTNGILDDVEDSDIILRTGKYGVMVEWTGTITNETVVGKYTLDHHIYTEVLSAPSTLPLKVYELKDAAVLTEDYLPLDWKVKGDTNFANITVKAAKAKVEAAFTGKTFKPNEDNALDSNITWKWDFEQPDAPIGTNSIYHRNDFADTILGDMIAQLDSVVVLTQDGDTTTPTEYTTLHYVEKPIDHAACSSTAWIAYTGDEAPATAPKSGDSLTNNTYAVLTVTFNAALTVTQVD